MQCFDCGTVIHKGFVVYKLHTDSGVAYGKVCKGCFITFKYRQFLVVDPQYG